MCVTLKQQMVYVTSDPTLKTAIVNDKVKDKVLPTTGHEGPER
jgi:hypothetical protein